MQIAWGKQHTNTVKESITPPSQMDPRYSLKPDGNIAHNNAENSNFGF